MTSALLMCTSAGAAAGRRADVPVSGGSTKTIFADNDLLVRASKGHAGALAEVQGARTFITPNQLDEFLNVNSSAQRNSRRQFLEAEGVEVFAGERAARAARTPEFQETFQAIVSTHGRADAALAAFARTTGFEAVTMDRRLYNFITHTLQDATIPIRRVPV